MVIIGAGRIGSAFARMCTGFDMKVIYLHPPLTESPRHMISDREFGLMKNNLNEVEICQI